MKNAFRYLLIFSMITIVMTVFLGCHGSALQNEPVFKTENSFVFSEGDGFPVSGAYIVDTDTAVSVGQAVLEGWQENGYFPDYVLISCTYYEYNECWVLNYSTPELIPGADLSIKINAINGELQMWVNE